MSSTYLHKENRIELSIKLRRIIFLLFLAATACSIFYLWTMTEDRFLSNATFKISRQDAPSGAESALASLVLPGISDSGAMDSYVAIGFIQSADLLIELEELYDLKTHYSSPPIDFIFRLAVDAPLERRLKYYRKRIVAHFEKETGLTVVSVDTFDPALSQKISKTILERAEAFVNKINQDVAEQQITFILGEVERSTEKINKINREMLDLQNKYQFIRPNEVISASLTAVQELQMERLRGEAELASLLRDSPESPRIDTLNSRLISLANLIERETAKLSGNERDRLNQILMEYQEIELKLDVATRIRTGVEMILEKNRADAAARSRFFSVIQSPYLPEGVSIPRRGYWTITILFLGILGFTITRALVNSVFERN
jgi:capsular polysaccharide transport system permease protein